MTGDVWFRVEDYKTCSADEWDRTYTTTRVAVRRYKVVKETPKGVWLDRGFGDLRFVLRDAHKRFACPTLEEAIASFKARKTRQLAILTAQAEHVKYALNYPTGLLK